MTRPPRPQTDAAPSGLNRPAEAIPIAEPAGSAPVNRPEVSAISVEHLTVTYHRVPVLRDISLEVPCQSMIGIIGPNGAGKSTLLKAVMGLIPVDAGEVRVLGEPAGGGSAARGRIAYVPQTETVDWDFPVTVREVVAMGRYPHVGWFRPHGRRDREIIDRCLEQVGIAELGRRHIRQLSGGQQQRTFLARALAQEAEILFLDEPFAGVDASTENAIFELMNELRRAGKTLVMVNHDLTILSRFDRVALLNQRLIAYGPAGEVLTDEMISQTYGGRLTLLEQAETTVHEGVRP